MFLIFYFMTRKLDRAAKFVETPSVDHDSFLSASNPLDQ